MEDVAATVSRSEEEPSPLPNKNPESSMNETAAPQDEGHSEQEETSRHDDDNDNVMENAGDDDGMGSEMQRPEEQQEEEEEGSDDENEDDDASGKEEPVTLGGAIKKPAFCLLQGFLEDPNNDQERSQVSVPINRLPAMLGRTHNTSEENFFGLGKNVKALSRVQCCIEYRIPSGKIGQYSAGSKFIYQPNKEETEEVILNPTNVPKDEAGFYSITCKGKNPIRVNGHKVDQNQTCLIAHGSTIKISAFELYFILPSKMSTKTMEVTLPNSDSTEVAANTNKSKKRKAPEMVLSSTTAAMTAIPKVAGSASSASSPASPVAKKPRVPAWKTLQEELDKMSTDELLKEIDQAVEKDVWDRRCQFVGSTLTYRAVRDAGNSEALKELSGPDGVSKAQIVDWIHTSDRFAKWAELMQTKLEPKSYQTSIAKGMQRAGYARGSDKTFGRHVRWLLPADAKKRALARAAQADEDESKPDGEDATQGISSDEEKAAVDGEKDSDDDDDDDDDNDEEGAEGELSAGSWQRIKMELDGQSTDMLLEEFDKAVEQDNWDRRGQYIAATLSFRAVKEAAREEDFRQIGMTDGVSRAQVVSWVHESDRFSKWANYMQNKLKPRSYQSNIVKAMQRAGYERSDVKQFGCNVRWLLPAATSGDEEGVSDNDAPDDDDKDSDAQSKGSAGANEDDSGEDQDASNENEGDGNDNEGGGEGEGGSDDEEEEVNDNVAD